MLYFKYLFFITILIIAGCSSQPQKPIAPEKQNSIQNRPKTLDNKEREYYKKALTALYHNKLNESESILKQFEKNRPDLAGPLANLALIYYKKSDYELAKNKLKKSLRLNPDLSEALNLMGMIEVADGNIKQAKELYLKALKNKKNYANAHHNIALIYDIYFQDIEKAIFHYSRYLKLTKEKDKITTEWLEQLKNSLKNG